MVSLMIHLLLTKILQTSCNNRESSKIIRPLVDKYSCQVLQRLLEPTLLSAKRARLKAKTSADMESVSFLPM